MSRRHETATCKVCRQEVPTTELLTIGGRRICPTCHAAIVANGGRITIDPCPICHTPQSDHWRCARCGSRGHLTGRSDTRPTLCAWCERDVVEGPAWTLLEPTQRTF